MHVNCLSLRLFGFVSTLCFFGALTGGTAQAATLNVPSQYATIQAAIDAAVPGDEVVVADGIYTGTGNKDLDFGGKAITVRSESGNAAACIIDCESSGRGFYFHSGETVASVVEGFTIRNGAATSASPGSYYGGGVYCGSSNPTLTNCTISGNTTSIGGGGGGVYCSSASPTLTNCTISGNTSLGGGGGGVYCYLSSPTLTNCTISGNTTSIGGGVYCSSSSPTLINCTISGNMASGSMGSPGGGVYCEGGSPTLTNCTISGNTAFSGGGVYGDGSSPVLTNCTISGNRSSRGGGVYGNGSSPKITNCILWGDTPQEIYFHLSTPIVTYCDVQGGYTGAGNISVDPGFAFANDFHLMSGSPCIDTGTNSPAAGLPPSDADGNPRPQDGNGDGQAVADMGAYEVNPTAPSIALSPSIFEVFAYASDPEPIVRTLFIRGNTVDTLTWQVATDCFWLSVDPPSGSCQQEVGSVILSFNTTRLALGSHACTLTVSAPQAANSPRYIPVTLHLGNARRVPVDYPTIQAAIDAAAKYDWVLVADGVYTGVGNKDLDFLGKSITVRSASGNSAACTIDCQGSGRGFYFHSGEGSGSVVQGLTIRNGSMTSSNPPYYYGGGVYCCLSSPTLTNCTISGNTARYGGGVYCSYASPTLTNCTISGNTSSGGGGVYCDLSEPTLTNCTISGNTASSHSGGGGVYCYLSSPTLTNCTISGNTTSIGGGVYCSSSNPTLTNCTISENTASWYGAGLYCNSSNPTLTNCILWGDTQQIIYFYDSSTPIVTYCDVQGGYTGTGNIDANPAFVDAASGNYRLFCNSPCIDTGTNSPTGGLPSTDAEGNTRPLDGNGDGVAVADMGAYEYPAKPWIVVSPTQLVLVVPQGQSGGEPKTLTIHNHCVGVLSWALEWEAPWLHADRKRECT